jgi:hypothetical protein
MNQDSQTRKTAKRDSWRTAPMPELRKRVPFERQFTQEEFALMSLGVIPVEMEDKWFIFLEDSQLFFHRSWTGHCIYQLRLEKRAHGYLAAEAWVNRDKDQYQSTDDEEDMALLSFLIDNLLLGQRTPFPTPKTLPENVPPGLYQHHIAGTAYPEGAVSNKVSLLGRLRQLFRSRTH